VLIFLDLLNYILIVDLKYNNSSILGGHVMLAYKYNDIVYFFDPQRNKLERDPNTMSNENYIKKYEWKINIEKEFQHNPLTDCYKWFIIEKI
jgi:hypothetical protein